MDRHLAVKHLDETAARLYNLRIDHTGRWEWTYWSMLPDHICCVIERMENALDFALLDARDAGLTAKEAGNLIRLSEAEVLRRSRRAKVVRSMAGDVRAEFLAVLSPAMESGDIHAVAKAATMFFVGLPEKRRTELKHLVNRPLDTPRSEMGRPSWRDCYDTEKAIEIMAGECVGLRAGRDKYGSWAVVH